mmetsp:Transcript_104977/g.318530  ORF Transcript_104977/g.318530 Transcript_104977/m.318530 type:complete len:318 (-) Transcript_104977:427-1380(-)
MRPGGPSTGSELASSDVEVRPWPLERRTHLVHGHDRVVRDAGGGRVCMGVAEGPHPRRVVPRNDLQPVPRPDDGGRRQLVARVLAPDAGRHRDVVARLVHGVVQVAEALAVDRLLVADRGPRVEVHEVEGDAAHVAVAAGIDELDAAAVRGPQQCVPAQRGRGVGRPERLVGHTLVCQHVDALLGRGAGRAGRHIVLVVPELRLPVDAEEVGVARGVLKVKTLLVVEGQDRLRLLLVRVEQDHAVAAALGAPVQRLHLALRVVPALEHRQPRASALPGEVAAEEDLLAIDRLVHRVHDAASAARALQQRGVVLVAPR